MRNGGGRKKRWLSLIIAVALLTAYTGWAVKRPLPAIPPSEKAVLQVSTTGNPLAWPAGGQAAVGIVGTDILESRGPETPLPIASTAKVITALAVLEKKPLARGEQGPVITLTAQDEALFNSYQAQGGSVVPVKAGMKMSQYQMLQAIMLPSANNLSDTLAIWAFGSLSAYRSYANDYVASLGMTDTRVGSDASGLAPDSTSTARDLVKLGKAAMEKPVLAEIVGQSTAQGFPIVDTVRNVNFLLGTSNIVGVKTGNTDEAGGVFIGAAKKEVDGKPVTIVTTVAGASSLFVALKDSLNLIESAQKNFKPVTVVEAGQVVGSYKIPWGGTVQAVAAKDLKTETWGGNLVNASVRLQNITVKNNKNQTIGSVNVNTSVFAKNESAPVILKNVPNQPSFNWRLTHPN